jgi:hypothetical protein
MAVGDENRSGIQIDNQEADNQEIDNQEADNHGPAEPMPAQASVETQNSAETRDSAGTREFGADVEDEAARADAERAASEDARHRDTPADAMVSDPPDPASANGGAAWAAQDTGAPGGMAGMPAESADMPASPRDADARTAAETDAPTAAESGAGTAAETPAPASTDAAPGSTMDNGAETTAAGPAEDLAPGDVSMQSVPDLWPADAISALRERWREVQLRFVDDPSAAATEADTLVGEAIETLQTQLAMQRTDLAAWRDRNGGGDDTERLRVAVQRYREFLDRVLGV